MFKIELVEDWQKVLTQAWSVKFGLAGAIFYFLDALIELANVLPYLQEVLPQKTFLALAILCAIAGFFSRFLKQKGFDNESQSEDSQSA